MLRDVNYEYGNPQSPLLKRVREAGFNPIGITTMIAEETFVFATKEEANKAWAKFMPDGWWYSKADFDKEFAEYCEQLESYGGERPTVYWLTSEGGES